jgi:hypothetical protein
MVVGVDTLHIIETVGVEVLSRIFSMVESSRRKELLEDLKEYAKGVNEVWSGGSAYTSNTTCANVRSIFLLQERAVDVRELWDDRETGDRILNVLRSSRDLICLMYSAPTAPPCNTRTPLC